MRLLKKICVKKCEGDPPNTVPKWLGFPWSMALAYETLRTCRGPLRLGLALPIKHGEHTGSSCCVKVSEVSSIPSFLVPFWHTLQPVPWMQTCTKSQIHFQTRKMRKMIPMCEVTVRIRNNKHRAATNSTLANHFCHCIVLILNVGQTFVLIWICSFQEFLSNGISSK